MMAVDIRDAIAALHSAANYGGDESARSTVEGYLKDSDPDQGEPDEAPAAEVSDIDYDTWTKDELVTVAREAGIDASGTKAEIIARLRADDSTSDA